MLKANARCRTNSVFSANSQQYTWQVRLAEERSGPLLSVATATAVLRVVTRERCSVPRQNCQLYFFARNLQNGLHGSKDQAASQR